MKQTICNIIHDAIKKYKPEINTTWKILGFQDFEDMLNQILEEDSEHFESLANRDVDDMWDNLADELNNEIGLSIHITCDSIDEAKVLYYHKFKKIIQSLNLNPGDFSIYVSHPEGCEDLE